MRIKTFSIFILLLCIIACSKDENTNSGPDVSCPYFPYKVGTTTVKNNGYSVNVFGDTTFFTTTLNVISSENKNGKTYLKVEAKVSNGQTQVSYVTCNQGNIYQYVENIQLSNGSKINIEGLYLKDGAKTGDKWETASYQDQTLPAEFKTVIEVINTNVSKTVEGKQFSGLLEINEKQIIADVFGDEFVLAEITRFYHPDIGIVLSIGLDEFGEINFYSGILEYKF
jgi:hypothetical protein